MNELLSNCLGSKYFMVGSVALQATHLVVFAHLRIGPLITDVTTDNIALGMKGQMGNKGAVNIKFKLAQTRMSFTCAHTHSG